MASGVSGDDDVRRQLKKLPQSITDAVAAQIIKGATQIQGAAVESIQRGAKTGTVYEKGKGISHQASAPGEAPASDTGNLARRIEIKLSRDKLRAEIGVHNLLFTPYARALELGSKFIKKRPYMAPAYNKFIAAIRKGIRGAVSQGVRNA